MFFVLSKTLAIFTDPFTVGFLGALGMLLAYHHRWTRKAFACLLIGMYSLSAPIMALPLLHWLEGTRPVLTTLQPHYDIAIVLSGMTNLPASTTEQLEFTGSVDRILVAITMLKTGRVDKLLISGGSSSPFEADCREALRLKEFALQQGVTEEQLLIEAESRNTYENAVNTARLLHDLPQKRLLLITSAAHMARSIGVFRKQGLLPDPYAVDFTTTPHIPVTLWSLLPSSIGLQASTIALHELVGLLMYRLQGYL